MYHEFFFWIELPKSASNKSTGFIAIYIYYAAYTTVTFLNQSLPIISEKKLSNDRQTSFHNTYVSSKAML